MNKTQLRISYVLSKLSMLAIEDEDFAVAFYNDLENLLTNIHSQDGFGTEGQNDPRGDFRDDDWSMDNIHGIDD